MSQESGVIQEIQSRSVAGNKTAYDIVIAGQRYGAGLYAPKAKVGDYVTFTVSQNGNFKNVERGTLKVGKAPKGEEQAAIKAKVGAAVNSFDARQDAISRQAASNTAIAWVSFLQAAGALTVPATKGKAQAALDLVRKEYEKEFYEANTGNAWKDISPSPKAEEDAGEYEGEAEEPEDRPWE